MSEPAPAPLHAWVVAPLKGPVLEAIERLRRAPDVRHVAVMPDVHLAEDVCIGVAVGTTQLIYPQAVGGDIGCGMLAVPFDARRGPPRAAGHRRAGPGADRAGRARAAPQPPGRHRCAR